MCDILAIFKCRLSILAVKYYIVILFCYGESIEWATFSCRSVVKRSYIKTLNTCFLQVKFTTNAICIYCLFDHNQLEKTALLGNCLIRAQLLPHQEIQKQFCLGIKVLFLNFLIMDVLIRQQFPNQAIEKTIAYLGCFP